MKRCLWKKAQPSMDLARLVFIDESGAKTNMTRLYGRAMAGQRAVDDNPCGHWCTTTMISSVRFDGSSACMVVDGATTKDIFEAYVEQILLPTLTAGDIVVLDNLSAHKSQQARELIESVGAELWYLPAYSPDLNPIEKMWSKIKSILRKLKARTEEELIHAITIPHELNPVAICNKAVVYDILFNSVAQTLQEFGADRKNGLGGIIGFTAILHTWDQKLLSHIHLHCVIAAGALSFDGKQWISSRKKFLFSVKALSKVFRGKFIDYFKKAFAEDKLIFPGQTASLATVQGFTGLIKQLWQKDWVVYSKAPFNGPQKVLDYLGRYIHRVAISNNRIVNVADGLVTFKYRDRVDGDKCKQITITAEEFIRRFLLHTIPDSYKKIRHFGFLANRRKKENLRTCRQLLRLPTELPQISGETTQEKMLRLTGTDITECPCCKRGHLKRIMELPKVLSRIYGSSRLLPKTPDTS